jgi:hypothetical protein
MRDASVDLLQPFVLGCDTKQVKIVQLCLTSIQKLLQHHIVNQVRIKIILFSFLISFSFLIHSGICSYYC